MATPSPSAALDPPYGVTPDFQTPESLEKWNTVCVAVCLSITSTLFFLRCFVRLNIKREWILEDYMCCCSWIGKAFLVAFCTVNTIVMHKHGGVHMWDLTVPQVHQATYVRLPLNTTQAYAETSQWFNIASIIYAPAILLTKIAILLLYRRVFSPHRKGIFDLSIRMFILVLCLFYLSTTLVKIWECSPRERIWNKSVEGTCVNVPALLDASGICNTLTDLVILLMPIHVVWNLKTTARRKIGVVLVFTVGFIAPAFSLVGVIVRFQTDDSLDTTWNQPTILLWGAAEVSCGIICVCIPALAILAHRRTRHPTHSHPHLHHSVLKTPNDYANLSSTTQKHHHHRHDEHSTDEVNLFDALDLELQHPGTTGKGGGRGGVRIPPAVVTTGIVGGKEAERWEREEREEEEGSSEGDGEGGGGGGREGIVRTVRMEQTYI